MLKLGCLQITGCQEPLGLGVQNLGKDRHTALGDDCHKEHREIGRVLVRPTMSLSKVNAVDV